MSTKDNLAAAFAGESQASRKYTYFAEKADADGHKQVARLFRAAAEAETVHARNHLNVLGGIKSTKDNVLAAISGEHYEFTKMYPEFIKQAEAEGDARALDSFGLANKVEMIHHSLYEAALRMLEKGQEAASTAFYVCQHCGNTVEGEAPDVCPVCGYPKNQFKRID
ncbi:MAG: rubrerythrin family protein [Chloroflexi bacterium]|nr:rubrerythrin family protein [Chloroflexota bacterium]